MAFPTGTISADDIRAQLARNNTAGAQTPVTLNDTAVRAAANRPSGAVSYNDLRGVNVLYSGLITFGNRSVSPGPGSVIIFDGYSKNFPPQYGGAIGSVSTTSYYRECDGYTGGVTPLATLGYDSSSGATPKTILFFDNDIAPYPTSVSTIYITIDSTRYTLTPSFYTDYGWFLGSADTCNFIGRSGQTSQVVITYT
jgi:hypothetical protein